MCKTREKNKHLNMKQTCMEKKEPIGIWDTLELLVVISVGVDIVATAF